MSDNNNPVTREEMYLSAAAGENTELPEPITRKELFLAKAAGDEKYMPILTSPGGKKFKLTVDDSGTVSAVEVTG